MEVAASTMEIQPPKDVRIDLPPSPEVKREQVWEDRNFMPVEAQVSYGWCDGHFEKGVSYKRFLISYDDVNGDPKVKDKWYCELCLTKLKGTIDKQGGILYGS